MAIQVLIKDLDGNEFQYSKIEYDNFIKAIGTHKFELLMSVMFKQNTTKNNYLCSICKTSSYSINSDKIMFCDDVDKTSVVKFTCEEIIIKGIIE